MQREAVDKWLAVANILITVYVLAVLLWVRSDEDGGTRAFYGVLAAVVAVGLVLSVIGLARLLRRNG